MKKMNKYMKTTIITVIILALFTIAQRDKIIGYFEPKCIEEGCDIHMDTVKSIKRQAGI